jgi:hypothetical protein
MENNRLTCRQQPDSGWRIRWVIVWRKTFTQLVDYLCMCILKGDNMWLVNHSNHPVSKFTHKLYKIVNDVEYFIRGRLIWDESYIQNKICKEFKKEMKRFKFFEGE